MADGKAGIGAAGVGVLAVALCCAAPFLIVAGGAIVATVGWTYLGVGAGAVILLVALAVALYRYRRTVTCESVLGP